MAANMDESRRPAIGLEDVHTPRHADSNELKVMKKAEVVPCHVIDRAAVLQ